MSGIDAELVFSVEDAGPDWAWPQVGPLGTGGRPPALPLEHGCSLVLAGTPVTLFSPSPAITLPGRAQRVRPRVSST
ncbi:MAG TPA: hypothetical protein VH134_04865 [Candidatus Dormibacteraeota bacterium]|jgi:hypothetical protein|nr:hypothetical protein [Candidatus Dormibacteraeota bacterium]